VILRDPVHGLISFEGANHDVVLRLLETREVQRLRRIRCLGPASLAFPGAEHSRFAHAVGSTYVMKRYLARVRQLSHDIPQHDRIDADTERAALAAALLHDLGHGPLSHTFEAIVPQPFAHEQWTSMLLLDPDTEVHRVLAGYDPQLPRAVERLIHGKAAIPHLARAVSGTFDVDRCDYLMRDSHMTGVRYGSLDLNWLLQALRLYVPPQSAVASLAVDGEKGLTAVEGFFVGRLYMYRQVYLHKAVRAAEAVLKAMFRRLQELPPDPGTPPTLQALLEGRPADVAGFLELDDDALATAIRCYEHSGDRLLAELAARVRHRKLFKTLRVRADVPVAEAQARLTEILSEHGVAPTYVGSVDRVEVDAYVEDEALMVLNGGELVRLLEASPLLHALSRERFIHYRVVFPPQLRDEVRKGFADFAG
jgi:hypothetical protein